MKVQLYDFEEAYSNSKPDNLDSVNSFECQAPTCFVNSYAPVSKAGTLGTFNNNTYFLQPTRKFETVGAVPVRSADFKCT
jgi:hypothetical protein